MKKVFVPPIKSQGIKTKMIPWIRSITEQIDFDLWIEPFMGTGVVAFNVPAKKSLCSDTNPHLINFYKSIQSKSIDPFKARTFLQNEGKQLLVTEGDHYYTVRERFNKSQNPLDFLFLSRACFNGMMRFNKKGGYNVPFCKKPNRFAPALITKICNQIERISYVIEQGDFEFQLQSFTTSIRASSDSSLVYCDPPYIGRNVDYFDSWSEEDEHNLYDSLVESDSKFLMSTWLLNKYRKNDFVFSLWNDMFIDFNKHFYHVGGKESNRNAVYEAILSNIKLDSFVPINEVLELIERANNQYDDEDNNAVDHQLRLLLEKATTQSGYKSDMLFSVTD